MASRQSRIFLIALVVVILLQHLFILKSVSPSVRFVKYSDAANQLFQKTFDSERITDFSMFYLHFHWLLKSFFGSYDRLLIIIQITVAGISVLLLFFILEFYFPSGIAFLGSLLFCFSSGLIVLSYVFVPEIWVLFFTLLGLYFFLRFLLASGRNLDLWLSAIAFGFSLITRPTILLYLPFLLLATFYQRRNDFGRVCAVCMIGIAIFVSGAVIRNYVFLHRLSLTIMDPGAVFFEGNNPYFRGDAVGAPAVKDLEGQYLFEPAYAHVLWKRFPAAVAGKRFTAEETSVYWSRKALRFLKDHPLVFGRFVLWKLQSLFSGTELHDMDTTRSFQAQLRAAHFPLIPVSWIAAFAFLGMVLARKNWTTNLPFYGGLLAYAAVNLIYFVSIRYRQPIVPFLTFFFCAAVLQLWKDFKERRFKNSLLMLVLIVVLACILDLSRAESSSFEHLWESVHRADRLQREGAELRKQNRREEAALKIAEAVAIAPYLRESLILANVPGGELAVLQRAQQRKVQLCRESNDSESCLFDLGLLLLATEKLEQAKAIFQTLAASGQQFSRWHLCSPEPLYYLGRIELQMGNRDQAKQWFLQSLNSSPGDPSTLASLSVVFEKEGGSSNYRTKLFDYMDEIDATYFLGTAYWYAGDYRQSAICFEQVVKWLPDYRKAKMYAAAAQGLAGNAERAALLYQESNAQKEDPLVLQNPLLSLLLDYARNHPDLAQAHFLLGVAQRRYGDFEAAFASQKQALALDPSYTDAKNEIRRLCNARALSSDEPFCAGS